MRSNHDILTDATLDPTQRGVAPRAGQIGFTTMRVKSIDEGKRQIHFLCSTAEIDRYGEIIAKEAWEGTIESFMANPVFPAGHIYVGKSGEPTIIGSWVKLWVSDEGLEGIAEFDDEDELAIRYWNLYRKGRMKAVSVGFIAIAWEMRDVTVGGKMQKTRVFTAIELIEISAVAIGANRSALVRAGAALDVEQRAQFIPYVRVGIAISDDDVEFDYSISVDKVKGLNKAGFDALKRTLLSVLESCTFQDKEKELNESEPGRQVGPQSRSATDDAAASTDYLASFLDDDGDIPTGDDTASRAADHSAGSDLLRSLDRTLARFGR